MKSTELYLALFRSGDLLGHSNNFIFFFWNQLKLFFAVCFGLLSWWKVTKVSSSSSWWMATNSSQEFPVHGSIHLPFNNIDSASTMRRETAPYHDASTLKTSLLVWCF